MSKTFAEYTGSNVQVSPCNTLCSDVIDLSRAGSGVRTSTILATVLPTYPRPVLQNGDYPVYVDLPRAHAVYCAYHSWRSCGCAAPCSSRFSGTWTVIQVAIRKILPASIHRDWQHCPTSAVTTSRKPVLTPRALVGSIPAERRMATSAPGRLMFRWFHLSTRNQWELKASGRTAPSTSALAIRKVPDRKGVWTDTETSSVVSRKI